MSRSVPQETNVTQPTNVNVKAVLQRAALEFQRKQGLVQVYNEGFINEVVEQTVLECVKVIQEQRDPPNLNYKPTESISRAVNAHFGVK